MTTQSTEYQVLGRDVPLADRDREIAELDALLRETLDRGRNFGVLVIGSRGVGKTRLVDEWLTQQARRRPSLRVIRAAADEGDGPYALWRRLLAARFGLTEGMSEEEARAAVRQQVSEVFKDRRMTEILHFLGVYLGLVFPENPFLQTLEADPEQHLLIARRILLRFLEEDAKSAATVLVADNLQWADDPSVELLADLAANPMRVPFLIVAVTRPEGLSKWPSKQAAHWKKLEVGNLDADASFELLASLFGSKKALPPGFAEHAVALTGGNPYFLEELFRLVVSKGIVDPESGQVRTEALDSLEVPLTVEDAVQARAAALSPKERFVLELGSVFGSVFWVGGVTALMRAESGIPALEIEDKWVPSETRSEVLDILDGLAAREYVVRMPESWVPGDVEYAFKHSVEYEITAAAIRPETRERRHFLAAQWLERRLRSRSAEVCEEIARHYGLAKQNRRAAFFYLRAGDEARARFANAQALEYYKKGLDLLPPDDFVSRLDALHNLGDVQALVGQLTTAEETFLEMLRGAYLLDDLAKGGAALGRLGRLARHRGEYDLAEKRYQKALSFFQKAHDERGVASTLDDLGKIAWARGDLATAVSRHRQALALREKIGDSRSMAFTLANLGVVYQDMGLFEKALSSLQKALHLYEQVQDTQGMVTVALNLGMVWRDLGELDRAEKVWTEAMNQAKNLGDVLMQGYLWANLGDVRLQRGDLEGARQALEAALSIASDLGDRRLKADVLRRLGRLQSERQQWTEASHTLKQALEIAREVGNKPQEASILRDLAALDAKRKLYPEAEERYLQALEIFRRLGNRKEEATTRTGLAAFYRETGEMDKAAEMERAAERIRQTFTQAARRVAEQSQASDIDVEIDG